MTKEQTKLVEKYHDYVLELIKNFDVEQAEFYDELCIKLCELAISNITEDVDQYFVDNLTQKFHAMLKRKLEECELITPIHECVSIPSECIEDIHRREEVNSVFFKLPVTEKECLELYFIQGYTIAEVSEIIKISKQQVKTLIKFGKKRLAEAYGM